MVPPPYLLHLREWELARLEDEKVSARSRDDTITVPVIPPYLPFSHLRAWELRTRKCLVGQYDRANGPRGEEGRRRRKASSSFALLGFHCYDPVSKIARCKPRQDSPPEMFCSDKISKLAMILGFCVFRVKRPKFRASLHMQSALK